MSKETLKEFIALALMMAIASGVLIFVGICESTSENTSVQEVQKPSSTVTEIPCTIVAMSSETRMNGRNGLRTYYFVEAEDEDGTRIRFQTGESFWNAWKQGDSFVIVQTITESLYSQKVTYTLDGNELTGLRVLGETKGDG